MTSFLYFSSILNKRLIINEKFVGTLKDAAFSMYGFYPILNSYLVMFKSQKKLITIDNIESYTVTNGKVIIKASKHDEFNYNSSSNDFFVCDIFWDKQIVDTFGAKVERVNDLQIMHHNGKFYLIHADIGFSGLMRRLGFEKTVKRLIKFLFTHELKDKFIFFKHVQAILPAPNQTIPLKLTIANKKIYDLHPAEIAEIMEDLSVYEREHLFSILNTETQADTIEELDEEMRVPLLTSVNTEKMADIIEEMETSDAREVLKELPEEKLEIIFNEIENEKVSDLKESLEYSETQAGSIMDTEVSELSDTKTIREALDQLKQEQRHFEYNLYILNSSGTFCGTTNLKELLLKDQNLPITEIIQKRTIAIYDDDNIENVYDIFRKYNLSELPVVDRENKFKGLIKFETVLDKLYPEE